DEGGRNGGQLQRLVDGRRVNQLLNVVSLQDIAEAWMRYQRRGSGGRIDDEDWWAVQLWMSDDWWRDERRVRQGILCLVDLAESDEDFDILGAAIMEVFATKDDSRLRWIEENAALSEK